MLQCLIASRGSIGQNLRHLFSQFETWSKSELPLPRSYCSAMKALRYEHSALLLVHNYESVKISAKY